MNVLELFAGIGGLSLGLERSGMTVVGQVELDPFCRSVLNRHWPEVPKHDDVRTAVDWWRGSPRPRVDVIAGGFPCQPASLAGKGLAQQDPRWLWPAFADVVRALRPRYVIVENVPSLASRGLSDVLADLAVLRFDAEWSVVSACSLGAPHSRRRLFVVAYPNGLYGQEGLGIGQDQRQSRALRGEAARATRDAVASAWRDSVDRSVATAGRHSRDVDGLAGRMVAAGGNAVVPVVGEYVGRILTGLPS